MKETKGKFLRRSRGITLVALVVTIVILIILATISVSAVFGENGIIQIAQQGKQDYLNAQEEEKGTLGKVEQDVANILAEPPPPYVDSEITGAPVIAGEMTPVKYVNGKWQRTTSGDTGWYNYGTKNWANAVLKGATFDSSGNLDESKTYSMVVWIPRYAYKITNGWHNNPTAGGTIDVKFIDTANKDKTGTVRNGTYNGSNGTYSDYVVHPAFNYGGTQIPGFWVGKFESSNTEGITYNGTGKTMQIKAGVTSWRNITVDNIYKVCTGFSAGAGLDPHMLKNTEWGAVAYLSKSKYGKETEEVWINNSSSYITGSAGNSASASADTGTTNDYKGTQGVKASTTGNVTGVYDMSGGAYEYVAGYVNNSYADDYGASVVGAPTKHKDVYSVGSSDSRADNYTAAASKYGDAAYEISNSASSSSGSWYQDCAYFPYSELPWFLRGGYYKYTTGAGVLFFSGNYGGNGSYEGFRVALVVPTK